MKKLSNFKEKPKDKRTEKEKQAFLKKIKKIAENLKGMPGVIDAYVEK